MAYSSSDEPDTPFDSDEPDNTVYNKILNTMERLDDNIKNIIRRISHLENDIKLVNDQLDNIRIIAPRGYKKNKQYPQYKFN